eukprot:13126178-Alexandrium_andersonii.AAC.1
MALRLRWSNSAAPRGATHARTAQAGVTERRNDDAQRAFDLSLQIRSSAETTKRRMPPKPAAVQSSSLS